MAMQVLLEYGDRPSRVAPGSTFRVGLDDEVYVRQLDGQVVRSTARVFPTERLVRFTVTDRDT